MRMTLSGSVISSPKPYAGQSIDRGFSAWVQSHIESWEEQEAALILQRGRFVSVARPYKNLIEKSKSVWGKVPVGVCYSYQQERVGNAQRMKDSIRDFSACPESLVRFVSR